jgi:hypothetical protein
VAYLTAMPTHQTHEIHASASSRDRPAQVMVAVLTGPDAPAIGIAKDLERWRRLTPLAGWTTITLKSTARSEILHGVAAVLEQQHIAAHQLILLGEGIAMRRVLELLLRGALVCAGMLAIDIPCAPLPFRIVPTDAAIRLVVPHGSKDASDDLIRALQAADLDERIITLNPTVSGDARVAVRAAEIFVLELVAIVGRQAHHGGRTDEIQDF